MNTKPDDRQHDAAQDIINNFDFMKVVDPTTDPFGLDYMWLKVETPFDEAFDGLVGYSQQRWHAAAGPGLRRVANSDSMACGTDEQLLEDWAKNRFRTLCLKAGESGKELLRLIEKYGDESRGIVQDVDRFLEQQPELAELDTREQVALAFIVIALHGPKRKSE